MGTLVTPHREGHLAVWRACQRQHGPALGRLNGTKRRGEAAAGLAWPFVELS